MKKVGGGEREGGEREGGEREGVKNRLSKKQHELFRYICGCFVFVLYLICL